MTQGGPEFSRRQFLGYGTAAGVAVAFPAWIPVPSRVTAQPAPTLTWSLHRRGDFLALDFEFYNLVRDPARPAFLKRLNPAARSYIVAIFSPQHLADEAFYEGAASPDPFPPKPPLKFTTIPPPPDGNVNPPLPAPGFVRAKLARRSRLAFEVPASLLPLRFNAENLMAWDKYTLNVVTEAAPQLVFPGLGGVVQNAFQLIVSPILGTQLLPLLPAGIRDPQVTETALELPWALVLSPRTAKPAPNAKTVFIHRAQPFTHDGRSELWHTRYGVARGGTVNETAGQLRAVWARDPNFAQNYDDKKKPAPSALGPFRMAMRPEDREDIVRLTSDPSTGAFRAPIEVNRLMLSSLGAWLDSRGAWKHPELSLEEWRHVASMGRDAYVRIVRKGRLMPLRHRAVKIRVTERKFHQAPGGGLAAYLRQREFIVVRQPNMTYTANQPGALDEGRRFPFTSVRITTLVTPDLAPAEQFADDVDPEHAYLPMIGSQAFHFELVATDRAGQHTEFTMPLVFVREEIVFGQDDELAAVIAAYNNGTKPHIDYAELRRRPMEGQRIAYAEETPPPATPGDTSLDTTQFSFGVEASNPPSLNPAKGEPAFYPVMRSAKVRLRAAATVTGADLEPEVAIADAYRDDGFDAPNKGQVFLALPAPLAVNFSDNSDQAGALAPPNLDVTAITRPQGPVGGSLASLKANNFDPTDFFSDAQILGGIPLADIIATGQSLDQAPSLHAHPPVNGKQKTTLDWSAPLKKDQSTESASVFVPGTGEKLNLHATFITDLVVPSKSTFSVQGDMRNFALRMLGSNLFLVINFKQLTFNVAKDTKPDLHVELGEVRFDGHLAFVEGLRSLLPSLGTGLSVNVTDGAIDASLSLALPNTSVGVFVLQNISVNVGAKIPFNGDSTRVRFSFCTRENPFLLAVSMFGGGGFLALECGLDKKVALEVALEFGAAIAFDIGVASGGIEVMAGIYIALSTDNAKLTGYLRMAGEVEVLGLITVSCELYLGFEYQGNGKCTGTAMFRAEIDLLVFSGTVTKELRRTFGGDNDPTFAELLPAPAVWAEYCEAYAIPGQPGAPV